VVEVPITGSGFTVTVVTVLAVQVPIEPVNVYVVLPAGVTLTVLVFTPPALALQVYVVAVPPVSITLCPAHAAGGTGLILNVGVGLTVMVTLLVLLHPLASLPVTV
jgi:hypothetical protein